MSLHLSWRLSPRGQIGYFRACILRAEQFGQCSVKNNRGELRWILQILCPTKRIFRSSLPQPIPGLMRMVCCVFWRAVPQRAKVWSRGFPGVLERGALSRLLYYVRGSRNNVSYGQRLPLFCGSDGVHDRSPAPLHDFYRANLGRIDVVAQFFLAVGAYPILSHARDFAEPSLVWTTAACMVCNKIAVFFAQARIWFGIRRKQYHQVLSCLHDTVNSAGRQPINAGTT